MFLRCCREAGTGLSYADFLKLTELDPGRKNPPGAQANTLIMFDASPLATGLTFVDEYVPRLADWSADGDWSGARDGLLPAASIPDETALPEEVPSVVAVRMLAQWMSGASIEELRDEFSAQVPSFADPMEFNDFVQRFFVNAAPWGLSSALQLLRFTRATLESNHRPNHGPAGHRGEGLFHLVKSDLARDHFV